MNWLRVLLGFSALLVAGCAAYFSVTGLGVLFSGASGAVMVMAGSLEFAKLVSATYLKQRWDEIKGLNKWYLTTAVVILMLITSAGIFGFLSNAFQQQNIRLQQVQREIDVWETKIKSDSQQIASLTVQLTSLQTNQGKIIDGSKVNNRLLRSIDNRDKQSQKLQDKINALQDSSVVYNGKINDIKNKNIGLEREIGGFRFVAESFNLPLNTVVKFFIILIVFVFDPLAVALIIAFNQLLLNKNKKEEDLENVNESGEPVVDNSDISKVNLTEEDLEKLEKILLKPKNITENQVFENDDTDSHQHYNNDYDDVYSNDDEYIPTPEEERLNRQEYYNTPEPNKDNLSSPLNIETKKVQETNEEIKSQINEPKRTEKIISTTEPEVHTEGDEFSTKDEKLKNNIQEEVITPIIQDRTVQEPLVEEKSIDFRNNEIQEEVSEILKQETKEEVVEETKPEEVQEVKPVENVPKITITPNPMGEKKN